MKRMWIILLGAVGVYVLLCVVYYTLQSKIIFHPVELEQDYQYSFSGQRFTEHTLQAPDGACINLLWFRTPLADSAGSRGVVVYSHGNAGNLARWGNYARDFTSLDYDLIIYDYRTYGKSTGKLTESKIHEDAQMVYDFAKKHYPEETITVFGRSLGTGVATRLASLNSPQRLILETPYFSLVDMGRRYVPFLPASLLMRYTFRTDQWIKKVKCPVYIFHGTEDEVVPYESGEMLRPLLKKSDRFITIPDGQHNNLNSFPLYRKELANVLNE